MDNLYLTLNIFCDVFTKIKKHGDGKDKWSNLAKTNIVYRKRYVQYSKREKKMLLSSDCSLC